MADDILDEARFHRNRRVKSTLGCLFSIMLIVGVFALLFGFTRLTATFSGLYVYRENAWEEREGNLCYWHYITENDQELVWQVSGGDCQFLRRINDTETISFSNELNFGKNEGFDAPLALDLQNSAQVWGISRRNILYYDGNVWQRFNDALPQFTTAFAANSGRFMAIETNGNYTLYQNGVFSAAQFPSDNPTSPYDLASVDDTFWVAHAGLWKYVDGVWQNVIKADNPLAPQRFLDHQDSTLLLWYTADNIVRYDVTTATSESYPFAVVGVPNDAEFGEGDVSATGDMVISTDTQMVSYNRASDQWQTIDTPTQLSFEQVQFNTQGALRAIAYNSAESANFYGVIFTGLGLLCLVVLIVPVGGVFVITRLQKTGETKAEHIPIVIQLLPDLPAPVVTAKKEKRFNPQNLFMGMGLSTAIGFLFIGLASFSQNTTLIMGSMGVMGISGLVGMGRMFYVANQLTKQIEHLKSLTAEVESLLGVGEFEKALAQLEQVHDIERPTRIQLEYSIQRHAGNYELALASARDYLVYVSEDPFTGLLMVGNALMDLKRNDEALTIFKSVIEHSNGLRSGYLALANWYAMTNGDSQRAKIALEARSPHSKIPDSMETVGMGSLIYALNGDMKKAKNGILSIDDERTKNPSPLSDVIIAYYQGRVAEAQNDRVTAHQFYQKIIDLLPKSHWANLARERLAY